MSFVITQPEMLAVAAGDLQRIGIAVNAVDAAAASPTTGVVPAAAVLPTVENPASRDG